MFEKTQLNQEQLDKVTGGTYKHESGYVFYTMEEIKKLKQSDACLAYQKYKEDGSIKLLGNACFFKMLNDTTAAFTVTSVYSHVIKVGNNDEYFVGPIQKS